MDELRLFTFVTDIGLVGALVYFCFRCLRAPGQQQPIVGPEVLELGSTLRVLIKEAERASKSLNEELGKRQQALEQVIFDAGSAEQRINRAIDTSAERKASIESILSKIRQETDEFKAVLESSRSVVNAAAQSSQPGIKEMVHAAEAPASSRLTPEQVTINAAPNNDGDEGEPRIWSSVNIFGEEIAQTQAPELPTASAVPTGRHGAYKSLTQAIEKQVAPNKTVDHETNSKIQEIYNSAEEMLKAGMDLTSVSARTNLPMEEVRLLSHMVEREREAERSAELDAERADPRLGVLGTMRRQVQVL